MDSGPDSETILPFPRELVRSHRERLDLSSGLQDALILLAPLAVGFAFRSPEIGVLAAIGTLNVLLVRAPRPARTRLAILAVAVMVNAAAFAAGALVSTAPP